MSAIAPAAALAGLVSAYLFVDDLDGLHAGRPIDTSPMAGAVLTVNFGTPNRPVDGAPVPMVTLLGPQSSARAWRSGPDTSLVMVHLTPRGVVALFPAQGQAIADRVVDLGALIGDADTRHLRETLALKNGRVARAAALDRWLIARADAPRRSGAAEVADALRRLDAGHPVGDIAMALGIGRRHLHRLFVAHLGFGPSELNGIARFNASLVALQTGVGDAHRGYSDDAHRIRSWRRHIGQTPARYAKTPRSPLVGGFAPHPGRTPAFYL